jgi:hypothetical protein
MIYAIPAGIGVAGAALLTHWVAARFDAPAPPAWATRRHARELVSAVILTIWIVALLIAGEAFFLFDTGKESPSLFALGVGIAALGALPAVIGMVLRKARAPRKVQVPRKRRA